MNERNAVPPSESRYDAVDLVCVPRYEYARLIAAKTKLDVVAKYVSTMSTKPQDVSAMVDVLFAIFSTENWLG